MRAPGGEQILSWCIFQQPHVRCSQEHDSAKQMHHVIRGFATHRRPPPFTRPGRAAPGDTLRPGAASHLLRGMCWNTRELQQLTLCLLFSVMQLARLSWRGRSRRGCTHTHTRCTGTWDPPGEPRSWDVGQLSPQDPKTPLFRPQPGRPGNSHVS